MKKFIVFYWRHSKLLLCVTLCLVTAISGNCQTSIPKNNAERMADLDENGVRLTGAQAIALFPKDSLPENRMAEIVDSLDLQISTARKFMGGPLPWQLFGIQPITFYFSNGDFVSNASVEGYIFVPFWRIKGNKAPVLHEIMHVLLRSTSGNWNLAPREEAAVKMPIWFTEGLPEYMAQKIASTNRFPKFDVHRGGGYLKVDSTCHAALQTEIAAIILPYIGSQGVLLELFGDKRAVFAPPFYNCSCSLTKHLAEKYTLDTALSGIAAFAEEQKTIETLTGKTMAAIKSEWLQLLADKYPREK
jgi:hypothetical protein